MVTTLGPTLGGSPVPPAAPWAVYSAGTTALYLSDLPIAPPWFPHRTHYAYTRQHVKPPPGLEFSIAASLQVAKRTWRNMQGKLCSENEAQAAQKDMSAVKRMQSSINIMEGPTAFAQKRKPKWAKPEPLKDFEDEEEEEEEEEEETPQHVSSKL